MPLRGGGDFCSIFMAYCCAGCPAFKNGFMEAIGYQVHGYQEVPLYWSGRRSGARALAASLPVRLLGAAADSLFRHHYPFW